MISAEVNIPITKTKTRREKTGGQEIAQDRSKTQPDSDPHSTYYHCHCHHKNSGTTSHYNSHGHMTATTIKAKS